MSDSPDSLKNHLLLATPQLNGGFFAGSVTYVCEHDSDGAMGLVINHPMDVRVEEILAQLSLANEAHPHNEPVLAGGPLHTERGFVLHGFDRRRRWQDSVAVSGDIQLTTSLDILTDIAHNSGPSHALIALGYAGWAPGQLESELEENVWLTVPADLHLLFEVPHHKKFDAALSKLGIDLGKLAPYTGHA
ncbi:putative transcriptional regulator [Litorivivens lipolytica]|uniref:UPF0301 protein FHR99_002685 n=1 Tax=Litorivivens lipolytica TaxID=1524264 RepID=A0A7W4W6L8_9GAMM|nr:YqgE/AlgH family protein [Litorivivens lipolytica]MBB3048411.1 putative transcriptional regulator [Litorivivens lipolytica]